MPAAVRLGGLDVQNALKSTISPGIFTRKGAGLPLLLLAALLFTLASRPFLRYPGGRAPAYGHARSALRNEETTVTTHAAYRKRMGLSTPSCHLSSKRRATLPGLELGNMQPASILPNTSI